MNMGPGNRTRHGYNGEHFVVRLLLAEYMELCMLYAVWCGVRRERKGMHVVVDEVSVHKRMSVLRELYVLYY